MKRRRAKEQDWIERDHDNFFQVKKKKMEIYKFEGFRIVLLDPRRTYDFFDSKFFSSRLKKYSVLSYLLRFRHLRATDQTALTSKVVTSYGKTFHQAALCTTREEREKTKGLSL